MPIPLLFVVTMSACLAVGVGKKEVSKNYSDTQGGFFCFNALYGLVCAFTLWTLAGFSVQASCFTLLLGAVFGVVTLCSTLFNLRALTLGSWAYTTVIGSVSTLIPTLSGAIFWDERIGGFQIVGIVLMAVSIALSVKRDENDKKGGWQWLLFAVLSGVCTGLIGVLQKVHQTSAHKGEVIAFLLVAFAILCCSSLLATLFWKWQNKGEKVFSLVENGRNWKLKFSVLAVLAGVCVALNNVINLHLSGVVDSAVFFPIVNGGNLLLTILLATVLYKEKMTKIQYVGLLCGILAVICLCMK